MFDFLKFVVVYFSCGALLAHNNRKLWQCSAGNAPFLLCGDFNARTGNRQPYHVLDMEYFTTVAQDEQYGAHGQRRSQDSAENDFGEFLF